MSEIEKLYRATYKRRNFFKEMIYAMAYSFSSLPILVMEVFLRRNLGERRFSLSNSILSLLIMAFLPLAISDNFHLSFRRGFHLSTRNFDWGNFLGDYTTWYLFLIVFLYMFIKRYEEILNRPSVYETGEFTWSSGEIHDFFTSFQLSGKIFNTRQIETLLEPASFFIPGMVLYAIGQPLGVLLIVISIIYSLSMMNAYHAGDNHIMDVHDSGVFHEQFTNMVEGLQPNETHGARIYANPINNPAAKQKLIDHFTKEDTAFEIE